MATQSEVTSFYETHPISERQILDKLRGDGIVLDTLTQEQLQVHDQDHFGGIEANDILAVGAGIDESCDVLDVCCGLGGPSRYLAHNYGCRITGIDLTANRILGARRLTALTGMESRVTFQTANALEPPFDDQSFDVVISQEAFCHIPDKERLIGHCVRMLKMGGRLAFTDILGTHATTPANMERLQEEMAFNDLGTPDSYRRWLEQAGCRIELYEDISEEWGRILVDRLAMYRSLEGQTIERFGAEHFVRWDNTYSFFVALYQTGDLGGGRFIARRPAD